MVVDDSVVARGLTTRWLEEERDFEVVASCRSGREAVAKVVDSRPDVIILDVEMPDMDGVEALPLLLRARPHAAILMASSHTTEGAGLTLKCLQLGATDFLPKPSRQANSVEYRRDLVARVRALGQVAQRRAQLAPAPAVATVRPAAAAPVARPPIRLAPATSAAPARMSALAIGSSTGGPQALHEVLKAAGPSLGSVPILIVQHMPAGFTAALAEHLSTGCGIRAREAQDGEDILPGRAYVAPGGRHFSIARAGGRVVAKLDDGPRVNFCKPSVDPMFRTASAVYGAGLFAVMLTGMGSDGASAVPVVAAAGGRVVAQDEATSVVWGMPGAAAATGACSAVLPLQQIGHCIARAARGERM